MSGSNLARRYAPLVAIAVLQLLIIGFVPSKAARVGGEEDRRGLDPTHHRHPFVDHDDLGVVEIDGRQRLLAVGRLTHDEQTVVLALDQRAQKHAYVRLVVDEQRSDLWHGADPPPVGGQPTGRSVSVSSRNVRT